MWGPSWVSLTVVLHEALGRVGEAALRVERRATVRMLPGKLHVDDGFDVQPAGTFRPIETDGLPTDGCRVQFLPLT